MHVVPSLVLSVLVAMRLLPSAMLLPVLGGPLAPWSARAALTAMAAVALALVQPPEVTAAVAHLPLLGLVAIAAKELAIGAILALVASAPFVAADTAGRWIGAALGPLDARVAGVAGPTRTAGLLTSLVAVLVFFAIDGHLVVIGALAQSYDALPLLGGLSRVAAQREVIGAAVALLGAAVALAAPSLVAAALVDLVLGLATRGSASIAGGASALRGAAVVAFVGAGLGLLAVAMSHDLSAAQDALRHAVGSLGR